MSLVLPLSAETDRGWLQLEVFPVFSYAQTRTADAIELNRYFEHPQFFNFEIELSAGGFEYVMDLGLFRDPFNYFENTAYSNIPMIGKNGLTLSGYFVNTPAEGYLAFQNDLFDISVGRRKWAFGYGEYNMALGRQAPYYDGLWLSFNPPDPRGGGRWHYTFLFAGDEAKMTSEIWDRHKTEPYWKDFSSDLRWFMAHKLSYQGESWQFGISENMVISEVDPGFMMLMPIWHNLSRGSLNDSIDISFEKRFESWRLYGDAYMDDFTLAHETKGNPNAWGFYAGADIRLGPAEPFGGVVFDPYEHLKSEADSSFSDGIILSLQGALTSRYLYNRTEAHPFGKFVMFRRIPTGFVESIIGFPYGNDVIMAKASLEWSGRRFLARGGLSLLLMGEDNNVKLYSTGDYALSNILPGDPLQNTVQSSSNWLYSGIREINLIIDPELYFALTDSLSAYGGIDCRLVLNDPSQNKFSFNLGAYWEF
ncbi:MAG: hypothetical protein LBQ61_01460 [Spirochaetales bacterium]|nr:hypothetical protein [Spirochaetales bacterium]